MDFNDLTIDLEGRVYIAFADGCIDACATGNNSQPEDSRAGRGSVYFMANGPSLYVEQGMLAGFEGEDGMEQQGPIDCLADPCMAADRKEEPLE